MSDEPPVVSQMRCISATGLHDFMASVVVRAGGFPFSPKKEMAVSVCRTCGSPVMAGWNVKG